MTILKCLQTCSAFGVLRRNSEMVKGKPEGPIPQWRFLHYNLVKEEYSGLLLEKLPTTPIN